MLASFLQISYVIQISSFVQLKLCCRKHNISLKKTPLRQISFPHIYSHNFWTASTKEVQSVSPGGNCVSHKTQTVTPSERPGYPEACFRGTHTGWLSYFIHLGRCVKWDNLLVTKHGVVIKRCLILCYFIFMLCLCFCDAELVKIYDVRVNRLFDFLNNHAQWNMFNSYPGKDAKQPVRHPRKHGSGNEHATTPNFLKWNQPLAQIRLTNSK